MKFTLLALLGFLSLVAAWTKEDHEIFRLRDELETHEGEGVTFYDWLGVSSNANQEDLAKAYRKKGKALHPDKAKQAFLASRALSASQKSRSSAKSETSKAKAQGKPTKSAKAPKPTKRAVKPPSERELKAVTKKATEDFARLGLIYKILQGEGRERYDHFLANGFPAWRGTGYYYTRYRPGGGSVLIGLFVFAGGAVHYLVLVLGWKRQRDFVQRYIKQARTLAWGDSSSMAGIPGISTAGESSAASSALAAADDLGPEQAMTRRERRAQEKAKKKPSAKDRARAQGADNSGTATPTNEPSDDPRVPPGAIGPAPGPRKRVQAENGKILLVDSVGNVFLEEMVKQDEDDSEDEGEPQLFLLDADEMPRPTVRDTMVYRLPIWMFHKTKDSVFGLIGGNQAATATDAETSDASGTRRRKKVPLKPKPGQFGEAVDAMASAVVDAAPSAASPAGRDEASSGDDEVDGFVAVAGEKLQSATKDAGAASAGGSSGSKSKKKKNKKK